MLAVRGLSKRFGGIQALDGVDVDLRREEIVGLIGPNGSGKTTAFNVITGVYRPDRGAVALEGEDITGLPPHAVNRRGIARTFQNVRLFRNLSVLDNVRAAMHARVPYGPFPALLRTGGFRAGERSVAEKALDLLDLVGLADRRADTAGSLPYGDQRRLEIARALASAPKALLLDEPAAGMNPSEVARLGDFVLRIRERFRPGILLIEHQMRLVMCLCERIFVMDFGRVIAAGSPGEVRRDPKVIEAYLGEEVPGERP